MGKKLTKALAHRGASFIPTYFYLPMFFEWGPTEGELLHKVKFYRTRGLSSFSLKRNGPTGSSRAVTFVHCFYEVGTWEMVLRMREAIW